MNTVKKLQTRLKNVNFRTLVYFAKQNGWRNNLKHSLEPYQTMDKSIKTPYKPFMGLSAWKQVPSYNSGNNIIVSRSNDEIIQKYEVSKPILIENINEKQERLFRIAVNREILNKNLNPKTRQLNESFMSLTTGFKNERLSMSEIVNVINSGFAICCGILKEKDGRIVRRNESWIGSEMFCIDIDEGLSINDCLIKPETKHAVLIYTTPSHTDYKHLFRLLFPLPHLITDPVIYREVVENYKMPSLLWLYPKNHGRSSMRSKRQIQINELLDLLREVLIQTDIKHKRKLVFRFNRALLNYKRSLAQKTSPVFELYSTLSPQSI
jgi:hypothetical protein